MPTPIMRARRPPFMITVLDEEDSTADPPIPLDDQLEKLRDLEPGWYASDFLD